MPYKDKQKQKEYNRLWVKERRTRYMQGKKCEHCGSEENLENHHKDPNTKESHRIWTWKIERLEAELKKCIVLCKPCHGKAHRTVEHGTTTMYGHGCRCDACKVASATAKRKYRANLRESYKSRDSSSVVRAGVL